MPSVKQLIFDWLKGALFAYGALALVTLIGTYVTRRPAAIAAAWSAALPGAGQWYAKAYGRALQFLAIDISLIALGYLALQDRGAILRAAISPSALVLAMIGSLALLGFRIWASYDAYMILATDINPASRPGPALIGSVVAIGLLLATPHAMFGYYDVVHYNFITSVFGTNDPAAAPVTTTTVLASNSPTTSAGPGVTAVPVVASPPIWDGLERLNILLLGADSGEGRLNIRTDTMIVVSMDPISGDTTMFSVPRNYAEAPLPAGHGIWDCQCFPQLLNDLYFSGIQHPEAFPGPGTASENAVKGGLGEVLGLEIHYYAMVNLAGFIGVVDALGGVEIDVPTEIVEESYGGPVIQGHIVIPAGNQVMDGALALAYSRIRSQSSDYARMNRQRCVVKAVIDQSEAFELLRALPSIEGILMSTLQTDIPLSRLPDFIDLLPKINTDDMVALSITPSGGYGAGSTEKGQNKYNAELIQSHVALILAGRSEEVNPGLGSGSLIEACT
jgi:LCP family protein required for cell wall assembly